jgi:hypothetical protein
MKTKKFAFAALLLALAGTEIAVAQQQQYAMFTGNRQQVTLMTGGAGWNCEYRYGAQTFWRAFSLSQGCPPSLPI